MANLKQWLRRLYRSWVAARGRKQLETRDRSKPCRLILGAGYSPVPGWIATDIEWLNLLREEDWSRYFAPNSVTAMLAEHVWEHLTPEEGARAAGLCLRYLVPGGYLRIAVPDGLHPDPKYIEYVRPGGTGAGADDHKILYDYRTMTQMLVGAGFEVDLLEYFDEEHQFHAVDWDPATGMIHRSKRFDERNRGGALAYTSLIVDARKPATVADEERSDP
jgi:predicted SAM-dependent methyltransferase